MDKKVVQNFIRKYSPLICYSTFQYMFDVDKSEIDKLYSDTDIDKSIKSDAGDNFFYDRFNNLNQDIYCFYVVFSLKYDRESSIHELEEYGASKEQIEIFEKNCKERIKNLKYVHYSAELLKDQYAILRASVDDLFDRKEKNNNEKYMKRLNELKAKLDVEELFDSSTIDEIEFFCKNKTLITALENIINVRGYNEAHQMELTPDKVKLALDLGANMYYGFATDKITRDTIVPLLMTNPEEFDLDKILLLYANKIKIKLENTEWNKDNESENIKLSNLLKICKDEISKRVKYTFPDETTYSDRDLESDIKRIADDGYYISLNEERKIKESAENVLKQELSHLKILNFTTDDVNQLIETPGVFSYLITNNLISNNVRNEALQSGKISQVDIVKLFNDGLITDEELNNYIESIQNIEDSLFTIIPDEEKLNTYMSGKATLENIEALSEQDKQTFSKTLKTEKLLEFYKDKNQEELFKKYSSLFAAIVIREDNADEIGESIIDSFIDNDAFEEQDVKNLYNSSLITIGNILEICETENVADMLVYGTFRNDDIKRICTEKERYDVFYNALKREDISWQNKISLYRMSVANLDISKFPSDKQERIKDYQKACERILNFDKTKSVTPKPINPNPRPPINDRKTWNKYASDPLKRWDLFDSLGRYKYDILRSGVGIFKYEKLKLKSKHEKATGPIFVEQLFGKNGESAYGRATLKIYVTVEEFEKYENQIKDGDIFFNIKNHPAFKGKLKKYAHTKEWGNNIVDDCGFEVQDSKDKEDLEEIDRVAEQVKKSRKLIKKA